MGHTRKFLISLMILFPLFTSAQLTYPTRYPTAVIPHPTGGSVFFFGYSPMIYKPATGGGGG